MEDHDPPLIVEEASEVTISPLEIIEEAPKVEAKPKPTVSKPKAKVATKPAKQKEAPIIALEKPQGPDPYTDGGPMDLDRRYLTMTKVSQTGGVEVFKTTRTLPTKRDYFIPFEE